MTYKHIDGIKVTAQFARENGLDYRYRLDISLEEPSQRSKTACVVMQNPSYASAEVADKSVQFLEKVVFQRNLPDFRDVRRLVIINQFARIQTDNFQGKPADVGNQNDTIIQSVLQESDVIIVAWGATNSFESRKTFVLGLIRKMTGKHLLKTKMHPARGHYDGFIQPFDL
jgi:hypothetical protein